MYMNSRLTSLVLALAGTTMLAQETTGTVTGRVTSKAGQPVQGAVVTISGPSLLGERRTTTDAQGGFRIPLLPNGTFTMTAAAKDFIASKGSFRIMAGQTSRADAVLTREADVAKVQEAVVEVTSSTTQVDKSDPVTQTNFTMESLMSVYSSDLQAAVKLAPGVAGGSGSPKIRGGSSGGAKWTLNGVMINDQAWGYDLSDTTIPDLIESVAVIQSPLNARYGNTDGGMIAFTTTKGSNTFKGSLRAKYGRAGWGANGTPYPDKDGATRGTFYPGDDAASRSYDVTLSGPIWKDHITFSWGGTYSPASYWTDRLEELTPTDPEALADPWSNFNGTYYRDAASGKVFRNANQYQQNQYVPNYAKSAYNQFVLYWQVNADQQVEWNYTDNSYKSLWYGYSPIDTRNGGMDGLQVRVWNLAYKATVGSTGVLEARYGSTMRWWPHPTTPGRYPIYIKYGPSTVPDENGDYVSNSLIDIAENGYNNKATHGATSDRGDTFFDKTLLLNYTHLAEWNGTHTMDMGLERQSFQWDTQVLAQMPARTFYVPGQLAGDAGTGFANKYIVFNYNALVSDVDPNRADSRRVYDVSNFRGMIPALRMFQGDEGGTYWQPTTSLYFNDTWNINKHHLVMFGVRHDMMKVQDSRGDVFKYSVTTPRFQYKYDLDGDQTRVVNFSLGQFHNRVPGGQFQQFVNRRLAYDTTRYWTGKAPGANPNVPYLVDESAVYDLANYGYIGAASGPGTFLLDPSWKAPISTEITLGFNRNYADGGFWRVTVVRKTWKNLYDSFPEMKGTLLTNPYEPSAPQLPTYRRIMRNDPDSDRTYNSVEFEFAQPFGRLQIQGNYTYARLMTNASSVNDSPSNDRTPAGNFREYLVTLMPRADYNPMILQDPEHRAKLWASYDLSTKGIKSSVTFLVNYTSGSTQSRFITFNIPRPILPGYYDPANGLNNSGGLPTSLNLPVGGRGQFFGNDTWYTSLKYDVEVNLLRSLRWFTGIQITNPFNHRMPEGFGGIGGNARRDTLDSKGQPVNARYTTYGFRGGDSIRNSGWSGFGGSRSFTFETGLRF